jgi:hypothetical protein
MLPHSCIGKRAFTFVIIAFSAELILDTHNMRHIFHTNPYILGV